MANDVITAVEPVVDVLEDLGVRYRIGGSVASSALGVPRSTLDVDVACELRLAHVAAFAARLIDAYYVDEDMIRDAISRQSCFNVIHLATMLKVDLFMRRDQSFLAGGGVSERQWRDAVGVLAIQHDVIDWSYLRYWANELGLAELLARATAETG